MMLRSLYGRLALTLFILLCLVGLILFELMGRTGMQYEQEVAQKLNHNLAEQIVAEHPLIRKSRVNRQALDSLFHQLMVINPSIELYLLDPTGQLLAWSAPEGKVKRTRVDLLPIERFLTQIQHYPLMGDDPRDPDGRKVFSAAPIVSAGALEGYLYIVLGGQQYDDVAGMIKGSYIFEYATVMLALALAGALFGGLLAFGVLTRRLRALRRMMQRYATQKDRTALVARYPADGPSRDEIDDLGRQYNQMASQIDAQIDALQQMDNVRREMVANVSHDLRTPLTTMRGYLETLLLKDGGLTQDERRRYLQTALRYSERLGRLVEELFELARLDSYESVVYSERFSISELVQDVVQAFQLRAKQQRIRLHAELNSEVPPVAGDIAMMQRVLENLLENALRHTPAGGRVSVAVAEDSGRITVSVSDTGHGIAEKDVPRIFDRFYQPQSEHSAEQGSGLGLAIVKRILELHGSTIEVNSVPQRGTTFCFHMYRQSTA
jgi:two-component system, OmpR family, sensor kinase